jgi:hypothetical protein
MAAAVVGIAGAFAIGTRRQQRELSVRLDRLAALAASTSGPMATAGSDALPEPVERYLRLALPRRASIRIVRMRQAGTLRTDAQSDRWMAFTSDHVVAPHAPAFVWNAK